MLITFVPSTLELESQMSVEQKIGEHLQGYYGRVCRIVERLRHVEQRFDSMEDRVTKLKIQVLKRQQESAFELND